MAVAEQRFRMPDRVREIVRDVGLLDRDGMEVCAGSRRHLAGDIAFVVSGLIERERKRLDRRAGKPRGETEHGARVESAAQVTAHRHVGAHPQSHRFLKHGGKLFDEGAFVRACPPATRPLAGNRIPSNVRCAFHSWSQ